MYGDGYMKIGFLFAGQGSQYVGMGKDLYEKYEETRRVFDNIKLDFDVKKLCFEGPLEKLQNTEYAQSSILATSMAIAEVLRSYGIVPEYVAGLSLGEYSALCYAGAFDIETSLSITSSIRVVIAVLLPRLPIWGRLTFPNVTLTFVFFINKLLPMLVPA